MSLIDILRKLFVVEQPHRNNVGYQRRQQPVRNKYIIVRKNGCEQRYRINQYGEICKD